MHELSPPPKQAFSYPLILYYCTTNVPPRETFRSLTYPLKAFVVIGRATLSRERIETPEARGWWGKGGVCVGLLAGVCQPLFPREETPRRWVTRVRHERITGVMANKRTATFPFSSCCAARTQLVDAAIRDFVKIL